MKRFFKVLLILFIVADVLSFYKIDANAQKEYHWIKTFTKDSEDSINIVLQSDCKIKISIKGNDEYDNFFNVFFSLYDRDNTYFETDVDSKKYIEKEIYLKKGEYSIYTQNISSGRIQVKGRYSPKMSLSELTLKVGNSKKLSVLYNNEKLKWYSSNNKIAKVSKDGRVTGVRSGTCRVYATYGENENHRVVCKINVKSPYRLSIQDKIIATEETFKLRIVGGSPKARWRSTDSNVASVNSKGVVTTRKKGNCYIIAKVGKQEYKCKLSVVEKVTARVTRIYNYSGWNKVAVRISNNTSKQINYVTLNIQQYDNRGYLLEGIYDDYYINDSIPKNSSYIYNFWVNGDTKQATVKLYKVWFSDGTTYSF